MRRDATGLDRIQAALLRVGGAWDAAFGVAMLLLPGPAAGLLGIELPADRTWFALSGLLLLILAGLYFVAAGSSSRHALALVAGLGRIGGMILLFGAASGGLGLTFWLAGLVDGSLGAAHVAVALWHGRATAAAGGRGGGGSPVGAGRPDRT